ncbi:HlyIII-domain-containing protein [Marasmius fiardii PR-910]|nr:HlyIII-domain-containing protein [Marasmius fiardii PR-910]
MLTFDELPDWQRDNEYIVTGYRRLQYHWKGCFRSVYSYIHNETVNIHSHLWGAVLFAYLLMTERPVHLTSKLAGSLDSAVLSVFFLSAVFCLGASAFYHTFTCHSEQVASRCHSLDYSGIIVLIVGSFYPCLYYGFFCEPRFQLLYITSITLIGLGAAYIVLNPEYAKPTHRGARTTVFIGLGLSAVVPLVHWASVHGIRKMFQEMGFSWLLISGFIYIVGALLYANRVPERFAPGYFDYFFASHQIFHFCVIFAALAHYAFIITVIEHTYTRSVCVALRRQA